MNCVREMLGNLYDKDICEVITGERDANFVDYVPYNVTNTAALILKHLMQRNKEINIAIHGDVDMDGFGSAYLVYRYLTSGYNNQNMLGSRVNAKLICNKERIHGLTQKVIDYINNDKNKIELLIVVDSGTNDLELIQKANCDVVIIDHHDVLIENNKTIGSTSKGLYSISTNMVDGIEYDPYMSGCEVSYYVLKYINDKWLKFNLDGLGLEQWVGITLISDVIRLGTMKNQYFIDKLYNCKEVEKNLAVMMNTMGVTKIDKSLIGYKLTPMINSTIRCGESALALQTLTLYPSKINELKKYKEYQEKAVKYLVSCGKLQEFKNIVTLQVNGYGIPDELARNFCGVIAAKIKSKYRKSAFVYTIEDGKYSGSVRGENSLYDYRGACLGAGMDAQGHGCAYGLKITADEFEYLDAVMECKDEQSDRAITVGNVNGGAMHVDDIADLRKNGGLVSLAYANSRLSSNETIDILCDISSYIVNKAEKCTRYTTPDGITEMISFDAIEPSKALIYCELGNYGVSLYIRNM